jgi:hypothetical protein
MIKLSTDNKFWYKGGISNDVNNSTLAIPIHSQTKCQKTQNENTTTTTTTSKVQEIINQIESKTNKI